MSRDEHIRFANQAFGRLANSRPEDLVGLPFTSLLHAEDHAPALAAARQLMGELSGDITLSVRLLREHGGLLQLRMSALQGPDGGVEAVLVCAVTRDGNVPAEAAELAKPRDSLVQRAQQRRGRELVTLHRLAQLFAGTANVWPALERAVATIRGRFRATTVSVALLNAERDDGHFGVVPEAPWLVRVQPSTFGAPGVSLLERRRPLLANVSGETRPLPTDLCTSLGLAHCTSLMLLPLYHDHLATFGVLAIGARRTRRLYGEADLELASKVALLVAGALQTRRLVEQARHEAARDERERLIGKLHASTIQSLYGMMLMAELWSLRVGQTNESDAAQYLSQLATIARELLVELKGLANQHTDD